MTSAFATRPARRLTFRVAGLACSAGTTKREDAGEPVYRVGIGLLAALRALERRAAEGAGPVGRAHDARPRLGTLTGWAHSAMGWDVRLPANRLDRHGRCSASLEDTIRDWEAEAAGLHSRLRARMRYGQPTAP